MAKTEITFFDGFESGTNDAFEAYTDPGATACIPVSSVSPYSPGDIGQDGAALGNINMARDAFGFSLNYHNGDYSPINAPVVPFSPGLYNLPGTPSDGLGSGAELFNGNIASMMVSIPKLMTNTGGDGSGQMLYGYQYDQLNRLVRMNAYRGSNNQANTFSPVAIDDYKERISYDPNGNILNYTRNGTTTATRPSLAMDALSYNYIANTNKLSYVTDAVNDATSGNMEDLKSQGANNYTYDAIGNMVSDASAANPISSIKWTVYGKIQSITKSGGTINYTYDAAGNRISKTVGTKTTVYVRDATGNVMSVYEAIGTGLPMQAEVHLYGSSRLGIMTPHSEPAPTNTVGSAYGTAKITTFTRGEKVFELSNHLGNVLVTISDKRLAVSTNGTSLSYYSPDVITATDYAPFGMALVGRNVNSDQYRYGFNGKENDNEVKGEGNSLDFGARIYDPRIGRWLSTDPRMQELPSYSPYIFVNNNPLRFLDPDGEFLLDVHKRIVRNALSIFYVEFTSEPTHGRRYYESYKYNATLTSGFIRGIRGEFHTSGSGGIAYPDIAETHNKKAHFDQMNYSQIIDNMNNIKTQTAKLIENFKQESKLFPNGGYELSKKLGFEVGRKLHGIADFYSHSNYIELYIQMYGKTNDLSSVPTFDQALSNKQFSKFASVLKEKLVTGNYPGEGDDSHRQMNHDVGSGTLYGAMPETRGKKVTYETRAAEAMATKASKEYLDDVKNKIEK